MLMGPSDKTAARGISLWVRVLMFAVGSAGAVMALRVWRDAPVDQQTASAAAAAQIAFAVVLAVVTIYQGAIGVLAFKSSREATQATNEQNRIMESQMSDAAAPVVLLSCLDGVSFTHDGDPGRHTFEWPTDRDLTFRYSALILLKSYDEAPVYWQVASPLGWVAHVERRDAMDHSLTLIETHSGVMLPGESVAFHVEHYEDLRYWLSIQDEPVSDPTVSLGVEVADCRLQIRDRYRIELAGPHVIRTGDTVVTHTRADHEQIGRLQGRVHSSALFGGVLFGRVP